MDELTECSQCNIARSYLLETPCCNIQYCRTCLENRTRCPNCARFFNINDCVSYQPLQKIVGDVLVECRYCQHKTTEIMLHHHEISCPKNTILQSELVEALSDPKSTPKGLALERKKNIFNCFSMYSNVRHILNCLENGLELSSQPLPVEGNDEFFTHIILDSDTLAGLAIKYGVSIGEIKDANRLCSDFIHERTALKIPRKSTPVFTEADAAGLEALLVQRLVNRFRRKTNIKVDKEALYYLENGNMDMERAYELWLEDNNWEKTAPPFVSCIPSPHEELALFERVHKRDCCALLVF